jgi:hypothetical protein
MPETLPIIPDAFDTLERRLRDSDDFEGVSQVLRLLQQLGLSRDDLQVRLEQIRAVNKVRGYDETLEQNCITALEVILGYAGEDSLRWDAEENARLLIPRCLTVEQLHSAIEPALARSDMLPERRKSVPVPELAKSLTPILSTKLDRFDFTPQPASLFRVPKDRFTTRPAALLAPEDRFCFQALADMIAPALAVAAPSNVMWPRGVGHLDHAEFAAKPLEWDYPYVVNVDIERFFEHVDHGRLALILASELRANSVFTRTVEAFIDSIMSSSSGLPQGPSASDIFASCYLLTADHWLLEQGIEFVRYMDDYRFGAHSVLDARLKLESFERAVRSLGLSLNSKKTWPYRADTYRSFIEDGASARDKSLKVWFRRVLEERLEEAQASGQLTTELAALGVEELPSMDSPYGGESSLDELIQDLRDQVSSDSAETVAVMISHEAGNLRQRIVRQENDQAETNFQGAFIYLAVAEVWVDWSDIREVMLWYPSLARTVATYFTSLSTEHTEQIRAALVDWLKPGFDTDWVQCWACSVVETRPELIDDQVSALLAQLCTASADFPLSAAEATRALAAAGRLQENSWSAAHSADAINSELYLDTVANPQGYPWLGGLEQGHALDMSE